MKSFQVNLSGGLGNQMFQYAFAKALSLRWKINFNLDVSSFNQSRQSDKVRPLEIFLFPNIQEQTLESSLLVKYLQGKKFPYRQLHNLMVHFPLDVVLWAYHVYFQKRYSMEMNLSRLTAAEQMRHIPTMFIGSWQNESFFHDFSHEIRQAFEFPKKRLSSQTVILSEEIAGISNSVSIHVRRGDYLSSQFKEFYSGVCSEKYYSRARICIEKQIVEPCYIVFSDDMTWCRQNLKLPEGTIFVDWNKGRDSWQDMYLISQCHHHIVANSSFSWWGAWLGTKNQDSVTIAPDHWYADDKWEQLDGKFVVPSHWLKIKTP